MTVCRFSQATCPNCPRHFTDLIQNGLQGHGMMVMPTLAITMMETAIKVTTTEVMETWGTI